MPYSQKQLNDILGHPVFSGISEKGCTALLEGSKLQALEAGESLLKIFTPSSYLLVVSGELNLYACKGVPASAVMIPAGTWIGECRTSDDWIARLSFLKPLRMKLDIVTVRPSLICSIQEQRVKTLPLQDQTHLIRNLDQLAYRFIENLVRSGIDYCAQSRRLQAHYADSVRAKHADYQRSEMIQAILANYPKLPLFAGKLIAMLQSEQTSAADIVDAAKLDPSLAGLILRVANSPYYNLPQKVTDFQHAVLLLGFNQIYHMLMDSGIQSIMPKTDAFQKLRFDSVMLSFLSFELAMTTNAVKPVTASTIGLLQCIGKSVLLLMKKQHPGSAILIDGLDHGKLGASLLKAWNIPDLVCMTIEYQALPELCEPAALPEKCRSHNAVLYLAGLCYEYLAGGEESAMPTIFLSDYERLLGLPAMPVADLLKKHLKPGLLKRAATYPDNIRKFLATVESRLS